MIRCSRSSMEYLEEEEVREREEERERKREKEREVVESRSVSYGVGYRVSGLSVLSVNDE